MSKNRSAAIGAYRDCGQVLEAVLASGPARLPFKNRGAAINFRQRCYKLRQLLQKASLDAGSFSPTSPYDSIYIRLIPLQAVEGQPNFLEFRIRDSREVAPLEFTGEGPVDAAVLQPIDDDFQLEADALARRLGISE